MNWLAHVFLSENSIDFQVGNFLADPLKAKAWENCSQDIKKGMKTHLLIDAFTDKNSYFKQSKERLNKKGLLKAIVIDLTYDYLLYKNWSNFCNISAKEFIDDFYKKASLQKHSYSKQANELVTNMIKRDLLNFSKFEYINEAMYRVDKRLSEKLAKRDTCSSYYFLVEKNIDLLEKDFLCFFPQLCNEVKKELNTSKLKHIIV